MKRKILSVILACAFVFQANAQVFTNNAVGIDIGTYGIGAWFATELTPSFVLKAGFSYMGLRLPMDFQETGIDAFRPNGDPTTVDISVAEPRFRIPHGRIVAEWYPAANRVFSVVGGAYIGVFDFRVSAQVDDWENHSGGVRFDYFGVGLEPRNDGSFDGILRLGNIVKPYLGIGIGHSIAQNRIAARLDLGIAYQGSIRFISDQATVGDLSGALTSDDIPEDWTVIRDLWDLMNFWPVLNFSLSYRF